MTALCPIEAIVWATGNNQRAIKAILDCNCQNSVDTAIGIAHETIDFLLMHIGRGVFQMTEKLLIAEKLTAFTTFAIDRADDVIEALGRVRLDDGNKAGLDDLVNALRGARLMFIDHHRNLDIWVKSPENQFSQGERHAQP
jgi:hypothetical protein